MQQKQAKTLLKLVVKKKIHKSAEATGDFVVNKTADKITSMGKPRSKKRKRCNEHNRRNTRNLYSSRKEKANNQRLEIILKPTYKNGV